MVNTTEKIECSLTKTGRDKKAIAHLQEPPDWQTWRQGPTLASPTFRGPPPALGLWPSPMLLFSSSSSGQSNRTVLQSLHSLGFPSQLPPKLWGKQEPMVLPTLGVVWSVAEKKIVQERCFSQPFLSDGACML